MLNTIGEKIKKARLEKGWTLEQLALESELSQPTISRLENGVQFPRKRTLQALVLALNKPESYFFAPEGNGGVHPLRRAEDQDPKKRKALNDLREIYGAGDEILIRIIEEQLDHYAKGNFEELNGRKIYPLEQRRFNRLFKKDPRFKECSLVMLNLFESGDESRKEQAYQICKTFEIRKKGRIKTPRNGTLKF